KPRPREGLKAVKGGMEGRPRRASVGWKGGFESCFTELRLPMKPRASTCESLLHSSHRSEAICHAISDQIAARLHAEEVFICSARKRTNAAFALPSTAGARSLILIAPPCSPTTQSLLAFGTTCTRRIAIRQIISERK